MRTPHRLLLVDDHPTNIAILQEILSDDYVLAAATSGEEALALAPDFRPALILLDIMMPGIDGYETCRRLRANPALRHAKIIMVSAKVMPAERLQGYRAGADDYIIKPFDHEELLAKVRVYLRLQSVEEVDRLKTAVLVFLNHQTRTPLQAISLPLQLLEEDNLDAAERTLYLHMAQESLARLRHFVEQANKLSTMKIGQWDFVFHLTDLADLIRGVVMQMAGRAAERRVEIVQELPASALLRLDVQEMQYVITSLLANAIQVSPEEGRVVLAMAWHEQRCCLTVHDQGGGIDPDLLPYVLQEFPPIDLHHIAGHGLSLAIARHIIEAHGGAISVQSVEGIGTTFTVQLPLLGSADNRYELEPPQAREAREVAQ